MSPLSRQLHPSGPVGVAAPARGVGGDLVVRCRATPARL